MTDSEAYNKAYVDRRHFSKIRKDVNYTPNKKTVLAFAIALELSIDEAKDLLNSAEEYAQRVEEYSDNLKLATVTMLTGASDAESSANLIKQVWYNAIYEKRDDKTDKYTRPKGYFVSDFNDALGNLYADSSFSSKISNIEDNQDTVNALMKKLKNPPDEYKDSMLTK